MAQYEVNNSSIQTLLSWIRSGEIAIPEIQRPFVWDSTKVRDLIDSLYAGFPVGYIIVWKNPDVRLKDGTISSGKKILIDGQQRITALQAAIVGEPVIGSNYRKKRIRIARTIHRRTTFSITAASSPLERSSKYSAYPKFKTFWERIIAGEIMPVDFTIIK